MTQLLKRKIRIAHVITRMDRGGAPDIVRILFEKLDPERFDATLFFGATKDPSKKTEEFLKKIGRRAINVPNLIRNINPFYDCAAFFCLLRAFKKEKFDIIHAHTAKAGVLARIAGRWSGVRLIVYSPHGNDFYGYFGRVGSWLVVAAEKFAARFCDKIHALTELEKKELIDFKICAPEKIEVIYSGVELDALRVFQYTVQHMKDEQSGSQKRFTVGMVGRLEAVKGPQYFIEAAKCVLEKLKNVKFLVVGDGSMRKGLESLVRALGISEHVVFTGWAEDVGCVLYTLDILVLPSLNEAVGRSVLEAQAVGVPVVATKVGGVSEVVKDGVTGILVPARDAHALAGAILLLLNDDSKREGMSEAACGWVDEKFSDGLMAKHFEELYERMVQNA
jgi:glycosyltransferase involved in cell wall biosynthesis